jgi:hypothetical protein
MDRCVEIACAEATERHSAIQGITHAESGPGQGRRKFGASGHPLDDEGAGRRIPALERI